MNKETPLSGTMRFGQHFVPDGGFPRGVSSLSYPTPSVCPSRVRLGSLGHRPDLQPDYGGPGGPLRDRLDPARRAPDADTPHALPAGSLSQCPQPPAAPDPI